MPFKPFQIALFLVVVSAVSLPAGPYPPPPEGDGSDAVPHDDPAIVAWATDVVEINYGEELSETWKTPEKALGPAGTDASHVVVLGRGGDVVLGFDRPIKNGPGPDFAVFENGVNDSFLELAFVEVSEDGDAWYRFPVTSLTENPVGAFGRLDTTNIYGFAGRYRLGFGTPFDLDVLDAGLDSIRYLRLIDVIGDGRELDRHGNPVYDPYPTVGSAGFDLDAVAVLHEYLPPVDSLSIRVVNGQFRLEWPAEPGWTYEVQGSEDGESWNTITTVEAGEFTLPPQNTPQLLRVVP